MKSGAILWLGGWASNIVCWKNEIERLYPEQEHQFLDVHGLIQDEEKLLANVNTFWQDSKSKSQTATVIGWSMGSLVLHRLIALAREENAFPKDLKLISLCPVFNFCHPDGPWSESVLTSMIARLGRKREVVLQDFWIRIKGNTKVTVEIEQAWQAQVKNYSLQDLVAGLEYLRDTKIGLSDFPQVENHFLLSSLNDPITPVKPMTPKITKPHFTNGFTQSHTQWVEYPEGHLPFLSYPELVKKML